MTAALHQFAATVWQITSESAFWVIISLVVGGLVHEFLPSSRLRTLLNRRGQSAMAGAILFGACLPICSCGVIPLAISLYKSGIRLGPVMAFAAATPIINPAAVILSLSLLGPQITIAYVFMGLVLPYLLGVVTERWGNRISNVSTEVDSNTTMTACCSTEVSCCGPDTNPTGLDATPVEPQSFGSRVGAGLRWGLSDLGPTIAFYMMIGVLIAGLIAAFLPPVWVDTYLRESHFVALLAAAMLGASIYVCAVAHIPLVATLLAAGAAPGVAIVFLVTGTATNLPELIALYNTIGKRTVIIYAVSLIIGAMITGVLVNLWLMPGFSPVFDPVTSLELLDIGERLQPTVGATPGMLATAALIALALLGSWRWAVAYIARRRSTGSTGDGCCSG
jgi:uncharacterized membrane protein YraQ (UPF0718 family)